MNSHISNYQFQGLDKTKRSISLTYQSGPMFDSTMLTTLANLWDIAKQPYVAVEMNFLKTFPEVVENNKYYECFKPLFANGLKSVNWQEAAHTMELILKKHFVIDASLLPNSVMEKYAHDISIIIIARDMHTNEILGFMQCMKSPNFPTNNVKIIATAVHQAAQNSGLGKLMASTLFAANNMPITRIFLCTRTTNFSAINAYSAWGFTKQLDISEQEAKMFDLNHWIFMEYSVQTTDILQKLAKTLKQS